MYIPVVFLVCFLCNHVFSEPVLSLNFTEGAGSTVSQGENNGVTTLGESPSWLTSQDGITGLGFNGANYGEMSYTECCSDAYLENSWTLEFLVTVTEDHEIDEGSATGINGVYNQHFVFAATNNQFTNAAGAGISIGTNGISVYEHSGGFFAPVAVWQGTLLPGQWYHVVLVYNERLPSIYVQGEWVLNGLRSGKSPVYSPYRFGNDDHAYGGFVGNLAHVRLYSYAMSYAEIYDKYKGLVLLYPELEYFNSPIEPVLSLNFTEGGGSTVSQGENNGVTTLTGSPTWLSQGGINGLGFTGTNYGTISTTECCSGANLENTWTLEFVVAVTEDHEIDPRAWHGASGVYNQHYVFAPTSTGTTTTSGAGISIGTNGISVYEHGAHLLAPVAVWEGTLLPGQWYHVVIVYSDRLPSIYVQGHLVSFGVRTGRNPVYSPHIFGYQVYGGFVGNLAHIRLYNDVLDAKAIHEKYRALFPLEPVISLDFTEGFGPIASQGAIYGGNATLIDMAWLTDFPYGVSFQNSDSEVVLDYDVCCKNLNPSVPDVSNPAGQFTIECLVSIPDVEHKINPEGLSFFLLFFCPLCFQCFTELAYMSDNLFFR